MNRLTLILSLAMSIIPASLAQDPGWPRELTHQGARLVYYQPQVDEWKDFKDLSFRMAFCLTPAGGKEVVGVVSIHALADVSVDDRNVAIHNLTITGITFPSLDPATAQTMDRLARAFLDPAKTVTMSLDRLVACVPKKEKPSGVQLKHDPPLVFVSYGPAILLQLDGAPVRAETCMPGTMETCTRTPAAAGRNTTMETGAL